MSLTTAASLGKMPTTSLRRLISPLRRSRGLVSGMQVLASVVSVARWSVVSGQPGQGSLEHGRWAGRCHIMSCELALVIGRPCDQPGCAARGSVHVVLPPPAPEEGDGSR